MKEKLIDFLQWLQDENKILDLWYNFNLEGEVVATKYLEKDRKYRYYLFGQDAVEYYTSGYSDGDTDYISAHAVIAAKEDKYIVYGVFKEEVGITTLNQFIEAYNGFFNYTEITDIDYAYLTAELL